MEASLAPYFLIYASTCVRDLPSVRPEEVPGFNPISLRPWTRKQILAEPDPILRLLYSFAGA